MFEKIQTEIHIFHPSEPKYFQNSYNNITIVIYIINGFYIQKLNLNQYNITNKKNKN